MGRVSPDPAFPAPTSYRQREIDRILPAYSDTKGVRSSLCYREGRRKDLRYSIGQMMMVALGGGLGALARYAVDEGMGWWSWEFPTDILLINASGSFLIGIVSVLVLERSLLSDKWRLFWAIGFISGYTTFSAFAFGVFHLGSISLRDAAEYALLTNVCGLLAAYWGIVFARYWRRGKPKVS